MKIDDVKVGMRVRHKDPEIGDGVVTNVTRDGWVHGKFECGGIGTLPGRLFDVLTPDYSTLSSVLSDAVSRASEGKGKDRHADGKSFDEQPIVALNLTLSSQDGPLFQIQKKCAEASRFYAAGERERAENELLDCIVYAAGAVITGRKRE